ncbi:hypothetical protein [Pantoea sp. B65]|uniref:hypothetical protein n=1 Tax=Pantoea sp. B65 TaxID=2813359 RepID=UPI0039B4F620
MFSNINMVIRRLEQRVTGKERARQKVQISVNTTEAEIAGAQQQRLLLQQHLVSLVMAGETSLEAILENKAHQGSLQRRLAEIDLMLADKRQQLEQLTQQRDVLKSERNRLQRKADKMTDHLRRCRQQQEHGRQRRHEAETEELRNWQISLPQ